MACYDFDYAVHILRQAIDFAEIERDYVPARKWANEVERSGHELESVDIRPNSAAGQNFLLASLQSVATAALSPEEACWKIRLWLNNSQMQDLVPQVTHQVQLV
jgi:hypothetical protein